MLNLGHNLKQLTTYNLQHPLGVSPSSSHYFLFYIVVSGQFDPIINQNENTT